MWVCLMACLFPALVSSPSNACLSIHPLCRLSIAQTRHLPHVGFHACTLFKSWLLLTPLQKVSFSWVQWGRLFARLTSTAVAPGRNPTCCNLRLHFPQAEAPHPSDRRRSLAGSSSSWRPGARAGQTSERSPARRTRTSGSKKSALPAAGSPRPSGSDGSFKWQRTGIPSKNRFFGKCRVSQMCG